MSYYFLPCSFSFKHSNILVQGYSQLEPLYLSISSGYRPLLKQHLLGEILLFLLLCLFIYHQSSSAECKLHEGLGLCCLALYPLYLQQCLTYRRCLKCALSEWIDEQKQAPWEQACLSLSLFHWWGHKHSSACVESIQYICWVTDYLLLLVPCQPASLVPFLLWTCSFFKALFKDCLC